MVARARTYGEGTVALPGSRGRATVSVHDDLNVLLVEDDDGDALIVEDLLEGALPGARLTRARTFAQALATLEDNIDCLLLDLSFPTLRDLTRSCVCVHRHRGFR